MDVAHWVRFRLRSLGELLGLSASDVEKGLLRMEAAGRFCGVSLPARPGRRPRRAMLSSFARLDSRWRLPLHRAETEWCERRLLARIHRLTVGMLRKQIEPVTAAQFMRWLMRWQHVAPGIAGVRRAGSAGSRCSSCRDSKFPRMRGSGKSWRGGGGLRSEVAGSALLDRGSGMGQVVAASGNAGFGGDSQRREQAHAAAPGDSDQRGSDYIFRAGRSGLDGFVENPHFSQKQGEVGHPDADEVKSGLSHGAQLVLEFLRQRGASFFADIVRGTGKLKAEIETALWELVAAGVVTADGFDNLRSLIDPKTASGAG